MRWPTPQSGAVRNWSLRLPLDYAVGQSRTHVVQQEVREQVGLNIAKRGYGTLAGGHGRSVAERAAVSRLMSCEVFFFPTASFPLTFIPF
jgi:hypothetical protein